MTTKVTPAAAYAALRGTGLSAASATMLTAIGGAESGWNVDAVGDLGLENATWGPSVGVWQIRTLKADTGTGSPRDINKLRGNLAAQAAAAASIFKSSGPRAWSTYKNGSYLKYEGQATKVSTSVKAPAAGAIDPGPTAVSTSATGAQVIAFPGGGWDPLNWPGALAGSIGGAVGGAASSAAGAVWGEVQPFMVTSLFVVGGLALVVVGLSITASPVRRQAENTVVQLAPMAAMA